MSRLYALIAVVVVALLILASSVFTVDQRQDAIVFQLGEIRQVITQPGLYFKIPLIQNVRYFDNRIITLDTREAAHVQTSENKNLLVDSFVKWRIVDVVKYYKTIIAVAGDEEWAHKQLGLIVESALREQFGKRTIHDVVSGERDDIMKAILRKANTGEDPVADTSDATRDNAAAQAKSGKPAVVAGGTSPNSSPAVSADAKARGEPAAGSIEVAQEGQKAAKDFGIEIIDVRLRRVELPAEVSESVYRRMESERKRVANELRSTGSAEAEKIRADADRQREIIVAEAYRDAQRTKGEGDAKATAIYAQAFGQNPEFYSFYRSLDAYRQSFHSKSDLLVIEPNSDFFKYLKNSGKSGK